MRGGAKFVAVSSYIVGSRQVLLFDALFDGGFALSYSRCALGVGFRRYHEPEKALEPPPTHHPALTTWVRGAALDSLANYELERQSVYLGGG